MWWVGGVEGVYIWLVCGGCRVGDVCGGRVGGVEGVYGWCVVGAGWDRRCVCEWWMGGVCGGWVGATCVWWMGGV